MHWLATAADRIESGVMRRFHPLFWTVNFPRPMMATVVNSAADALDVTLVFCTRNDLAGLIWDSVDQYDHPLMAYETRRDYRDCVLSFRWRSTNLPGLTAINGPTLTIEGRDAAGHARVWYVRLWNYAVGSASDAVITLDFNNLAGGFLLPGEADPVYPGDIDRLFLSLMPEAYVPGDTAPISGGPVTARLQISALKVTGGGSVMTVGDSYVPLHGAGLANGYDDSCNLVPERILRNARMLGYSGWIDHYVGMSHYFHLMWSAGEGRFVVDPAVTLNAACEAWHEAFFRAARSYGFKVIVSLSFELFNAHAPEAWKQRTHNGSAALTGWDPPSTLLAPTNGAAMEYLGDVFLSFLDMQDDAGGEIHAQIGEPWWWYQIAGDSAPCFYDAATTALYTAETGLAVPAKHLTIFETPTVAQVAYLDWLGTKLGAATLGLRDVVRAAYPAANISLLFFTPQVLNAAAPMVKRVNLPVMSWAYPAFDCLDVEDYDYLIEGDWAAHEAGLDAVTAALGYGAENSRYFAGFVLTAGHPEIWERIDQAMDLAHRRRFSATIVWAFSQIMRDGFVHFAIEEDEVSGFHEVRFPEGISFGSSGGPKFATTVVETVSGHETRNLEWAEARAEYDVGTGVRSEADLAALIAFFRARRGRAFGFRFRDWSDDRSGAPGLTPTALDQAIGTGSGAKTTFQLVKRYESGGEIQQRVIRKPVAGSVKIALGGVVKTSGWSVDSVTGVVSFASAPPNGVAVTAGFLFDVPVRFRDDRLAVTAENFCAGAAPDVGLVEIRV
ncbi:DUF2460 domain-containing protein [Govanella unica]|uniref:DUF2460 domain-containing protein n=1 Tax=Govanella unica TaxID=2975056 RepID=A0A9X3U022_9PROT|nr:DUF2460 domain-containing protein [Govania unica]MDA5194954.1 DUF2460 domain-containing protein [Govania unica]